MLHGLAQHPRLSASQKSRSPYPSCHGVFHEIKFLGILYFLNIMAGALPLNEEEWN
jgi:hypothetical protein